MKGIARVYFTLFNLWTHEAIIQCDADAWFHRTDNNNVYYFSDYSLNWPDAKRECEDRDAHLVTINGCKENEFLEDSYTGIFKHWVGLHCPDDSNCYHEEDLSWLSGNSDYFNWQGGFMITNVRYVYIDFERSGRWKASDDRNKQLRYICEKKDGCHNPSSPCQNGGTCTPDNRGDYTCDCRNGFIGQNCQIVGHCASGPCVRGTCSEGTDSFICNCDNSGFTGTVCDDDIDECSDDAHNCVHNNSQCNNTIGSFRCLCYDGWIGNSCENDFNECYSNPCVHGPCINDRNRYDCICPASYTGINCESDIDECTQNTGVCNNGICQNTRGSFKCACQRGYKDILCNRDINECDTIICQNGATCVNSPGSYQCMCRPGYIGQNCSTDINECASDPCINGGSCTDHVNDYMCYCPSNFHGDRCQFQVRKQHATKSNNVQFSDNAAAIGLITTSLILLIGVLMSLTFLVRKKQRCVNSFHPTKTSLREKANGGNTFPKLHAKESADPKDVTLELNSATYENVDISVKPLYANVNVSGMDASIYEQLGSMVVKEQPYELNPKALYTSLQATHTAP